MGIFHKLKSVISKKKSFVCVGLDPHKDYLPISDVFEFNKIIIDSTIDIVSAYKPQFAFYESLGLEGLKQLKLTIEYIKKISDDVIIIGDAKRGDIDSTSAAYANSLFNFWEVDIATVNPYMGRDSILPFLEYKSRGIYVICRTSNMGGRDLQELKLDSGDKIYEKVAEYTDEISSEDNLGYVIGATYPNEIKSLREKYPSRSFLIPGIGKQGGDLKTSVDSAKDFANTGFLINASRSIIFSAKNNEDFGLSARNESIKLRDNINNLLI